MIADTEDGERIVRQRDRIAPSFPEGLRAGEIFLKRERFRRIQFADDHAFSVSNSLEQALFGQ